MAKKNIIICCDGTGNDFGLENSNIVKLFSCLKKEDSEQIVYYDPGVGTPSTYNSFNPLTRKLKYIFGAAFGYGLSDNILQAYKFLMKNYNDGDDISLFGFSRGAYTVRAIAGLVHTCGLMHRHNENLLPEAIRIYDDRSNNVNEAFKTTFGRAVKIHFLGLFDTVSSVGWVYSPTKMRATANNSSVANVRHAISLDEKRAFFRQNTWGKKHRSNQDVKEVWFAGVHSDVGGGYPLSRSALSNIVLEWMIVEAQQKGILFDRLEEAKKMVESISEPHLRDQNKSLTPAWYLGEVFPKMVYVKKKREGKAPKYVPLPYVNFGRRRYIRGDIQLHESVIKRMEGREEYRPINLPEMKLGLKAVLKKYKEKAEPWVKLV